MKGMYVSLIVDEIIHNRELANTIARALNTKYETAYHTAANIQRTLNHEKEKLSS